MKVRRLRFSRLDLRCKVARNTCHFVHSSTRVVVSGCNSYVSQILLLPHHYGLGFLTTWSKGPSNPSFYVLIICAGIQVYLLGLS